MMVFPKQKNKITVLNEVFFEQVLAYIQSGKRVTIPVKGNSMKPFLSEGDQVVLKPFESAELCQGLIVLARWGTKLVLHRVVRYNQVSIWLAGDGNLMQIEQLKYADVVATAVCLQHGNLVLKLDRRWRCMLGHLWYQSRPVRSLIQKCLNMVVVNKGL